MSPNIEIRIEGYLMDVDDKVGAIATTYQIFDFKSIGSIKANNTNRLTIPITNTNVQRLEQIAPLSVITTKPYRNLSIQIVQDGQEVITNGVCQIVSIQDRISLDIQSGIRGFWDALDGKYLNDIDTSTWDGLWDNNMHDTVRGSTSGLVCPVTNNGNLVDGTTYVDGYTYGSAVIPFFYYHTIITQIFTLVGYSKSGTIFSDTNRYLSMVMSCSFIYNQIWIDQKKFKARKTLFSYSWDPKIVGSITVTGYDSVTQGSNNFFDISTGKYTVTGASNKFFKAKFKISFKGTGNIFSVLYKIELNGVSQSTTTSVLSDTVTVITNSYLELKNADEVRFRITTVFEDVVATYTIDLRDISFEISNMGNTIDTDRVQGTDWHWYFSQLFQRILLKDFIRDFMRMFGLVITEKNKTVTFKTIKEILNDVAPSTVEISREDKTKKPLINYDLTGFSQSNYFYWIVQQDESIINDFYGYGKFTLDNTSLPISQDMYISLFTASDQITDIRINQAAQINIYNQSTSAFTKAASFGSRLLLLRYNDGVNYRFKSGTSRTDYYIGYFIDKTQTYSLDWQELVDYYYPEYADVLNRWTTVQQDYFVNLVEAAKMDLTKPVTKDGITYLIEKVENYISGRFAKFNLIRR